MSCRNPLYYLDSKIRRMLAFAPYEIWSTGTPLTPYGGSREVPVDRFEECLCFSTRNTLQVPSTWNACTKYMELCSSPGVNIVYTYLCCCTSSKHKICLQHCNITQHQHNTSKKVSITAKHANTVPSVPKEDTSCSQVCPLDRIPPAYLLRRFGGLSGKLLNPEKKRISRKQLFILKEGLKIKRQEREVSVGLFLGDGSLNTQDKGGTYSLVYSQGGQRHQAYFNHVYTIFKDWVVGSPRTMPSNSSCIESKCSCIEMALTRQTRWAFTTISHGSFRFYGKAFYKNGKKVVPKEIARLLTERGLAFWYTDDGSIKSKQSKGVLFNTQGFDLPDVERLCNVLICKFDYKAIPRVQHSKTGVLSHQIYLSGYSYERLKELILPHIIPEMLYKFPPPRVQRRVKQQVCISDARC